jgi:uncharacterized protein with beta-barrel porin domain/membrane-associated phospholipid phosphatase
MVLVSSTIGAQAQTANTTPSNVDVLNLLSPFLSLNATSVGQTTLSTNLAQAISVNNNATATLQQLSYSDKNILGSVSNTVTGLSGTFGVAGNLAGTLPNQPAPAGGVPGVQTAGGLGATLGAIYDTGINASQTTGSGPLAKTSSLLVNAYNFTSASLGVAKYYFANGTINGTTAAVAPSGLTLPTANGYPNLKTSVYDTAYGVSNTGSGQDVYGSSRPAQVAPSKINLFDPTALAGINTNPSFPSGHTNYAWTDSILTGMLVPQEYQSMLSRAAQYGNSRIVLGVHYPLDIIGSRSFAAEQLAQAFTNPSYINNATTTGTAINLPSLFTAANSELNGYLSSQCGASVTACASSSTNQNSLSPSAANAATYASLLNYGLPTLSYTQAPREQAPAGGPDASILLATVYGGSTSAAQTLAPSGGLDGSLSTGTINQILVNTEGQALSAFYGTPLSYWSRINLYAADGYFSGATGLLNMASTDVVNEPVTVAATGVLVDNGKINGATTVQSGGVFGGVGSVVGNVSVQSGGTLAPGGFSATGVQNATGTLAVTGALNLASGSTYSVQVSPTSSSMTTVTGAATLGGAVNATYTGGTTFKSQYTILTAGSVSGTFSGLTVTGGLPSALTDSLSYDAKDAYINVAFGGAQFAGLGQNQQNVLGALNASLASTGSISTTYGSLSPSNISHATGEVTSTSMAFAAQAVGGALRTFFNGGLSDPGSPFHEGSDVAMYYADLPTHKAPAVEAMPKPFTPYWTVWSTTSGGYQSLDGNSSNGTNNTTANNWSEIVGAEYRAAPDTSFGIGFGGGSTNYSVGGLGSGSYNYGILAAYGTRTYGSWYVTGGVAGGTGNVKNTRTDPTGAPLEGSYTPGTAAARLEVGDAFGVAPGATLTPYAAGQFNYAGTPSYSETPASAYALSYTGQDYDDWSAEVGVRAKQDFVQNGALFTIGGAVAYVYNSNPNPSTSASFAALPGSTFTTYGVAASQNSALVQAGAKVALANGWAIEARFDGLFGQNSQSYGGRGTVSYSW